MVLPHGMGLYTGHICTARFRLPPNLKDYKGAEVGGNWLTDLPPLTLNGQEKRICVNEKFLLRIDDPDNQEEINEENEDEACHS